MNISQKNKLVFVTTAYWFLLLYIVAALLWWFIALNNQNNAMATMRLIEINKDDISYSKKAATITSIQKRKTAQYIGEGISFLAVILVGAVFIYRATRRQIKFAQQQQNFMMAVTHELKTPIAITQLNLETIQKRKLDVEKQEKMINNTLQEVNRLNNLCNNILWAAQLDAGAYKNKKQEINLTDTVFGCIENFEKRYTNRKIISSIEERIYLNSDELMMQILINNLLENAVKYSPKETNITVELKRENNKFFLIIKDEGLGIADDEKKKVFEKFYRSGSEETRKTKGTGLGLYLCNRIVKNHKGSIVITNNKPMGSIFKIMINC